MRAINLIPAGAVRGGVRRDVSRFGPGHAVLLVLVVALALVTVYVLSANSVTERQAKLAGVKAQLAQVQARASQLQAYSNFVRVAQTRATTVREIAASRFDWYSALGDLSRVVPANLRLQSLLATVAPGVTISVGAGTGGSTGGAGTGTIRADINAPAFELKGCTGSHDDVARLMSQLQLINGVQRVTLADSTRNPQGGAVPGSAPSVATKGCGSNPATFDLVVFFQPLAGALASSPTAGATASTTPIPSGASK